MHRGEDKGGTIIMPRELHPENLKPLTTDKAREIGSKGGKASVKARKEKKLVSEMVRDFLDKEHIIKKGKKTENIDTQTLLHQAMAKILERGGQPAVALIKVIADVTEGAKFKVSNDGDQDFKIIIQPVKPVNENTDS
jgi:general stress protein YciG